MVVNVSTMCVCVDGSGSFDIDIKLCNAINEQTIYYNNTASIFPLSPALLNVIFFIRMTDEVIQENKKDESTTIAN